MKSLVILKKIRIGFKSVPRDMPELPETPRQAIPEALALLSVVIPARNEAGCIASTVEHLHVELRLHGVPHEIIVVDDGSTDDTWDKLQDACNRVPTLRPI